MADFIVAPKNADATAAMSAAKAGALRTISLTHFPRDLLTQFEAGVPFVLTGVRHATATMLRRRNRCFLFDGASAK